MSRAYIYDGQGGRNGEPNERDVCIPAAVNPWANRRYAQKVIFAPCPPVPCLGVNVAGDFRVQGWGETRSGGSSSMLCLGGCASASTPDFGGYAMLWGLLVAKAQLGVTLSLCLTLNPSDTVTRGG